jgi:plasmid stabilization system protein ParE
MEQGVPDIGQKFVNTILKNVQRLRDHPDSGRKVPEFNQDRIREIIQPPFRLVYLRNAASVNLVRVWRSERLLLLPDEET